MSRHQSFEHLFRSVIIFLLDISDRFINHHLPVIPLKFQTLFIVGNSAVKIIHALPRNASGIISLCQERVSFEASRTVIFRTLKIIQTDFCHSPVKIRLSQPGFRTDHLIEILD